METQNPNVKPKLTKSESARLNGAKGGRPRKAPATVLGAQSEAPASEKPVDPAVVAFVTAILEELTPRELLFVEAFCGVSNFDASDAYRRAGFDGKPSSVGPNAGRLIKKDRVAAAIRDRLAAKVEQLRIMDGDEALGRLTQYARADIGKVLDPADPLAQLPDDVRMTIKAVRPSRYGRTIELHDSMAATTTLAKAAGKFVERHDVKVSRSMEDILAEVNALDRAQVSA